MGGMEKDGERFGGIEREGEGWSRMEQDGGHETAPVPRGACDEHWSKKHERASRQWGHSARDTRRKLTHGPPGHRVRAFAFSRPLGYKSFSCSSVAAAAKDAARDLLPTKPLLPLM